MYFIFIKKFKRKIKMRIKLTLVGDGFVSRSDARILDLESEEVEVVKYIVIVNVSDTLTDLRFRV